MRYSKWNLFDVWSMTSILILFIYVSNKLTLIDLVLLYWCSAGVGIQAPGLNIYLYTEIYYHIHPIECHGHLKNWEKGGGYLELCLEIFLVIFWLWEMWNRN